MNLGNVYPNYGEKEQLRIVQVMLKMNLSGNFKWLCFHGNKFLKT